MPRKSKINPYYEKKCFAADFIEAEKRGDLIIPRDGESTIEAIRRHMEAKKKKAEGLKKTLVAIRLPVYVIGEAKTQAKKAGVSYTAYMQSILEAAIAKPLLKPAARAVK